MALIDKLMEKDKKTKLFNFVNAFGHYSTGILPLDYVNAFKLKWHDSDGKEHVDVVPGLIGGRFITIIGLSGGGKTTLADQIAWNIIAPFEDGIMVHTDCEHTMLKARIYDLTDMKQDDPRFILNDTDTYIEDVMKQVDMICETKEAAGLEAMYEIDGSWFGRDKVYIYYPTVIIIDSLPSFSSKDSKEDTLEGQMSTNREVGKISQFYQKLLGRIAKYNITIIAINHIKAKIETNPYSYTKPQLMMLKQGESLPRGEAPVFYASSVFRLNPAGMSSGYTKEEWGFDGFKCCLQVAKSKTTFIGGEINMVFREDMGYDPIYTLLQFAYDCGIVEGRNPGLYIKGAEEFKFSKKNFGSQFKLNPQFRAAVLKAIKPFLESIAGCKDVEEADKDKYISMSKLCALDDNGELVPINAVETDNGIELVPPKKEEKPEKK